MASGVGQAPQALKGGGAGKLPLRRKDSLMPMHVIFLFNIHAKVSNLG